ncbi:hypothetical protein SERLADRAFT_366799 [Serpula lacrymans var. lacrymans S7.9]|uniref:Sorbose reductase sou1 n=1 Tax=Serpula lacrymans var. lacrymans (strain S7.9) TaxID=578457 RepID=F8NPV3_SERL9|nr:uncharacterized protein SERLADRAFT_366799 [Serpula lacrymans var. lacrymans S7.9]EGO27259.1 hypothetical protein SERLADRAFT_366799 [Serpula lacrymans var. lacrymans S7.9]
MKSKHPGPLGVAAVVKASKDPSFTPRPSIWDEFSIPDRVAIVTGGNRNIGLEMALVLSEIGARAVYCIDLPGQPSDEFKLTKDYVAKFGGRLEYVSADVTNQVEIWDKINKIGDDEGRIDACIAGAGVLGREVDCLDYSAKALEEVMSVNVNGALFTAQAAGKQMIRFGLPGSIIINASIAGTTTIKGRQWVGYNTSKSAVLQMARSMACELGHLGVRVNTLSAGHIRTTDVVEPDSQVFQEWAGRNPLGRLGRLDEMRGVTAWLASDASTFCTGSDIVVSGGYTIW